MRKVTISRAIQRFRKAVILAAVFATVFFWAMVLRIRYGQRASWLSADAPAFATAGQPLELRVRLHDVPESGYLVATLHRSGKGRPTAGRLSSGQPRPVRGNADIYEFKFDVPAMNDLDFIRAVLYLSPTGGWNERIRTAYSLPLRVRNEGQADGAPAWKRLRFYRTYSPPPHVPDSRARIAPEREEKSLRIRTPVRITLFILLAVSGLLCLTFYCRRRSDGTSAAIQEGTQWMVFAVVFLLAALSEVFLFDEMLTEWGRGIAISGNVYFVRRPIQMAAIAVIAGCGGSLFLLTLASLLRNRALSRLRLVGMCLTVYLGFSLVEMLSMHQVDSWKRLVKLGVPLTDWGKGLGAAATLAAVFFTLFRDRQSR